MRNKKFIVTAVVALGLCFSVGAATGVKINAMLKDQAMKVNGKTTTSQVIAYNNATYVPLRQVGEMLGAKVDYKDGVVIIGESEEQSVKAEETNTEVATKIGDWVLAGTEDEPYYVNEKLKARVYAYEEENDQTTIQKWSEGIVDNEEMQVKAKSIEKVKDVEIGYVHVIINKDNQIEANIIDGDKFYTYVMSYEDNSDAATLKDELLKFVAADWE